MYDVSVMNDTNVCHACKPQLFHIRYLEPNMTIISNSNQPSDPDLNFSLNDDSRAMEGKAIMSSKSSNVGKPFYTGSMDKKGGDLRAGSKVQVLLTHLHATEVSC